MNREVSIKRIAPFLLAALLIWLGVQALDSLEALRKKEIARKSALKELTVQAETLMALKAGMESYSKRLSQSESGKGLVSILENIVSKLSIETYLKKMTPGESKRVHGFVESVAEVKFERLDLNQVVNLLYRIKSHSAFLSIKSFKIKSDFQEPDKLNISMTVSLIRSG